MLDDFLGLIFPFAEKPVFFRMLEKPIRQMVLSIFFLQQDVTCPFGAGFG